MSQRKTGSCLLLFIFAAFCAAGAWASVCLMGGVQ